MDAGRPCRRLFHQQKTYFALWETTATYPTWPIRLTACRLLASVLSSNSSVQSTLADLVCVHLYIITLRSCSPFTSPSGRTKGSTRAKQRTGGGRRRSAALEVGEFSHTRLAAHRTCVSGVKRLKWRLLLQYAYRARL